MLTQKQASERIGVSYKWFRRLCHQDLVRPVHRSKGDLEKVAAFFGVELSELWSDPNNVGRSYSPVLIKWTGSKRLQAKQIVKRFPRTNGTYFEPFVGGGSVLYELLKIPILNIGIVCVKRGHSTFSKREMSLTRLRILFSFLLRTCRNGLVRFNKAGKFTHVTTSSSRTG
ncbi:DNA adenine methylase [Polystyrenella longa]|uniref:DNA adenine methylase n=1 Tax=Polystyrenella longa TaxID=2528007 RepID=A0A518CU81_9PLAN|nr:DNA adenine methylase [Polystyrenella longa]